MRIERRKKLYAEIGLISVGLDTYWGQFPGLKEVMYRKTGILQKKLSGWGGGAVRDFGLIDNALSAYEALPKIKAADLDILFVDMVTYATSATIGAIFRELSCPVILVAMQEMPAMEYARGTTYMQLCNDDICSVPEFTGVAVRMGHPVADIIIGTRENDPRADEELGKWCRIARARHGLRHARLGHLGHVLEAMLDMQTDPSMLTAVFGCHIVQCEAEEILDAFGKVSPADAAVGEMSSRILDFFDTPDPVSDPVTCRLTGEDLETAARAAVALEHFIDRKKLDGLAYYYEGQEGSEIRRVMTNLIVGNSLLIAAGFPMCGEFDIKTCIAMLIMDQLEIGGSFAEFHPVDFEHNTVLLGHDGPHHLNIADGRPVIRSLKRYHGKPGHGAGVEFKIKTGPITILSISVNASGRPKFVIAEGESMDYPIPPTGNTNTHGRFQPDIRTFLKRWCMEGPTHHFALGIGHHADELVKIADSFGVESSVIPGE